MDTQEILKTWKTMNDAIMELSEDQLEELKSVETKGQNRLSFLSRIQGRINKLRSRRESAAILSGE